MTRNLQPGCILSYNVSGSCYSDMSCPASNCRQRTLPSSDMLVIGSRPVFVSFPAPEHVLIHDSAPGFPTFDNMHISAPMAANSLKITVTIAASLLTSTISNYFDRRNQYDRIQTKAICMLEENLLAQLKRDRNARRECESRDAERGQC
jgi:hypothetical protein